MKNNRKAVSERQLGILDLIRSRGEARVEELAQIFQTSLMTVRRDLKFLEKQKLLYSEWDTSEAKPRKYYKRTAYGDQIYASLAQQWREMSAGINSLIGGNEYE